MKYLLIPLRLISVTIFAETWSGVLVDSGCYEVAMQNHNPNDTSFVDRDMNGQVESCRPSVKTKTFAVVEQNWATINLDPKGNAQAAALVRTSAKKVPIRVTVAGEKHKNIIAVCSLSPESR